MGWKKIVLTLCVYGFLKEFRPSEPFISPFLNGPHKNFTEAQINQEIYPVATYSNLSLLIIIFLLTDWLKYKPVLVLGNVAGIITWTILPLALTIPAIQVSQFFYGLFCATEVAYYSYMYAKLDKKRYQRATSIMKAVILISKASSGLTSQALLHFSIMDYLELNYITLGAITLATIWSLFLPSVSHSMYFHNSKDNNNSKVNQMNTVAASPETDKLTGKNGFLSVDLPKEYFSDKKPEEKGKSSVKATFSVIFQSFKGAISNSFVIKWSLWWSATLCGYLQVVNYMQLLWQNIINNGDKSQPIYHGYMSTAHCIIGAICTYLVGFLNLRWHIYGEPILALCSILQGCLILQSTHIYKLITNYILFIGFRAIYQCSFTVASSEIAKNLRSESYALVFGVNTFIALLAQSILTILVIDCLKLDIRTQFLIYGIYHIIIGILFSISGCYSIVKRYKKKLEKPSTEPI